MYRDQKVGVDYSMIRGAAEGRDSMNGWDDRRTDSPSPVRRVSNHDVEHMVRE